MINLIRIAYNDPGELYADHVDSLTLALGKRPDGQLCVIYGALEGLG